MILPRVGWSAQTVGHAQGSTPAPSSIEPQAKRAICICVLQSCTTSREADLHCISAMISTPAVSSGLDHIITDHWGNPPARTLEFCIIFPLGHGAQGAKRTRRRPPCFASLMQAHVHVPWAYVSKLHVDARVPPGTQQLSFCKGQKDQHSETPGGQAVQGLCCNVVSQPTAVFVPPSTCHGDA